MNVNLIAKDIVMSRKVALTKQAATSDKEPIIVVKTNNIRNYEHTHVLKSSSVESNPSDLAGLPSIRCSSMVEDEEGFKATSDKQLDWGRALSHDEDNQFRWQRQKQLQATSKAASQESLKSGGGGGVGSGGGGGGGGSSSRMARKLGSLSKNFLQNPFSPLRPSISTSCLFTTAAPTSPLASCADPHIKQPSQALAISNAVQLVSVPTRASLTHQWRKLKTLNKCRECNMLVYFNGRECSQCDMIAHKKCMTSLVIKCDYQLSQQTHHYHNQIRSDRDKHHLSSWPAVDGLLGPLQVATATASPTVVVFEHKQRARGSMKQAQATRPIFGKPLVAIDTDQVLDIINRFVYEIDTRGLSSKGIYRVSSIKSKVDKLCHYFDHNPSRLIDLSSFHPNIIANSLKLYLRRLPEPLLTNDLYSCFIEIAKRHAHQSPQVALTRPSTPDYSTTTGHSRTSRTFVRSSTSEDLIQCRRASHQIVEPALIITQQQQHNEATLDEFGRIVSLLPSINKNILEVIMRHLRRVADMAEENQMSAKNLSIIFGPTLLSAGGQHQDKNSSRAIVDNVHQAHAIELMITWAYQIFPATATVGGSDSDANWQAH